MVKASPCRDECTDLHQDCPNLFSLIKLQSQGYQQNYLLSFASHRDGEQDSLYFYVNRCNSGIIDLLQITISSEFACWIASLVRHTNSTSLVINPDLDPCQRMYQIAIFKSWEFFYLKHFMTLLPATHLNRSFNSITVTIPRDGSQLKGLSSFHHS